MQRLDLEESVKEGIFRLSGNQKMELLLSMVDLLPFEHLESLLKTITTLNGVKS